MGFKLEPYSERLAISNSGGSGPSARRRSRLLNVFFSLSISISRSLSFRPGMNELGSFLSEISLQNVIVCADPAALVNAYSALCGKVRRCPGACPGGCLSASLIGELFFPLFIICTSCTIMLRFDSRRIFFLGLAVKFMDSSVLIVSEDSQDLGLGGTTSAKTGVRSDLSKN